MCLEYIKPYPFCFARTRQLPSYKGFRGTINKLSANHYMNSGEVAIIDSTTIEISELPVKTWTQVGPPAALSAARQPELPPFFVFVVVNFECERSMLLCLKFFCFIIRSAA